MDLVQDPSRTESTENNDLIGVETVSNDAQEDSQMGETFKPGALEDSKEPDTEPDEDATPTPSQVPGLEASVETFENDVKPNPLEAEISLDLTDLPNSSIRDDDASHTGIESSDLAIGDEAGINNLILSMSNGGPMITDKSVLDDGTLEEEKVEAKGARSMVAAPRGLKRSFDGEETEKNDDQEMSGSYNEENTTQEASILGEAPSVPSYIRLSVSSLTFPTRKRVFIDEASQALLTVSNGEVRAISLRSFVNPATGKSVKPGDIFARFHFKDKCGIMLVSPCCRYVAIQKSQTHVVVIALGTNLESTIECKGRSNAIVTSGIVWVPTSATSVPNNGPQLSSPCICLVTTAGLETYTLKSSSSTFSHVQSDYVNRTKHHWDLPSLGLICTATDDGEFHPYMLQKDSPYPEKWTKFNIENSRLSAGEAALAELYNEPWFLRIRPREMLLYRLTRQGTELTRTVQTSDGFALGVSVVDSLLLLHSPSTRVSLLYDVRDNTSDLPFTHPLPLEVPKEVEEEADSASTVVVPYSSGWRFLPPDWVFDARLGRIWKLELDLTAAANACARPVNDDPEPLARFLLRRSLHKEQAKIALFERMLQDFENELDLATQSSYLKVLAESISSSSTPPMGLFPVPPDEVCMRFFDALLVRQPPFGPASHSFCASLALEYTKFLFLTQQQQILQQQARRSAIKTSPAPLPSLELLFSRIAKWLVMAGRSEELYQLYLHRLETDSLEFCGTLLGVEGEREHTPQLVQAGLDCLKRLGQPREAIRELLRGQTSYVRAVRFASQSGLVKESDEVVIELFQSAASRPRPIAVNRLSLFHSMLLEHRLDLLQPGSQDPKYNRLREILNENQAMIGDSSLEELLDGLFRPIA